MGTTEQPSSKSFFLTEDSQNNSSSNLRILPDLESVEPQFGNSKSNAKHKSSGLLETHFTTDESKLGDAKAASAATELSANLRANYPPPPKIVCTDLTAAPAKMSKKADAKETQSKSKKASTAPDDKIIDSLNETLNTQQTPTTSSQASLDSKSSGNQTSGETNSSANPVATSNFSNNTDKKLDDPSNQETKEPSLVCMIGDIPNEATAVDNKNDPKIMQQTDNGTSITNLSKTEQKSDPKSTEKSGKTSKPYPKGLA